MIALLGDIHGEAGFLVQRSHEAHKAGATALIQVGDFGVYTFALDNLFAAAAASPIPIYFIDGNHEHYPIIKSWPSSEPKQVAPNLTYIPRGCVVEIDGLRVGFLGGAGSIDYNYRTAGRDWFPDDEQITDAQVERLVTAGPVDLLVTHTPPRQTIDRFFDTTPNAKRIARQMFGADPNWTDPSADKVQQAWDALGRPALYCGHMHRALTDENVRILDVGEMCLHAPPTQSAVQVRGAEEGE